MSTVRKELSVSFWTALARHRQNRLDFVGVPLADVQRMRDQNQHTPAADSYLIPIPDSS